MKKHYSPLKSILATASVAALVLGANEGFAADKTANANPARTSTAGNWVGGVAPLVNDNIILNGANNTVIFDSGGLQLENFDINGANAGASLTVSSAVSFIIQDIKNTAGTQTLDISYAAAGDLGVVNIEDGVGNGLVNNVDFGGNGGKLRIISGKVAGYIDGNHGNAGAASGLFFVGSIDPAEVTVTGSIGGVTKLTSIIIHDQATLTTKGTVNSENLVIYGNGILNAQANIAVNELNFGYEANEATLNLANGASLTAASTKNIGNIVTLGNGSVLVGNFGSLVSEFPGYNVLTSLSLGGATTLGSGGNAGNVVAKTIAAGAANTLTIAESSSITTTDAGIVANVSTVINNGKTLTLGDGTIVGGTINAANGSNGTLVIAAPVIPGGDAPTPPLLGVTLNNTVGANHSLAGISIATGASLIAGADITVSGGLSFVGSGLFNLGNHTLTGSVNFANGSNLIVYGAGNVTGGVTNNGHPDVGSVTRSSGNTGSVGASGSRIFSMNLGGGGNVTVDQNIFTGIINVLGNTLIVNENIGSNAANSTTSLFLNNGATVSISNGKQIFGPISGNGALIIAGDPSTSVIGAINIAGDLIFKGAGIIIGNVATTGLATVTSEINLVSGSNFISKSLNIAGGTFTVEEGANFTVTDEIVGVYGTGTFATKREGVLPQLGSLEGGAWLNSVSLNPLSLTARTYQASGTYKVTNFIVGGNATLDTSTSGLILNGDLIFDADTKVILGSKTLNVEGTTIILETLDVETIADANGDFGNIASQGGTTLTDRDITVNITNKTILPSGKKPLFSNVDGKANVTITGGGLNTFTYNDDGSVTIGQNPGAAAAAASSLARSGFSVASQVMSADAEALSEAAAYKAALVNALTSGAATTSEVASIVEEVASEAASAAAFTAATSVSRTVVSSRLSVQVPSSTSGTSKTKLGTSSGEETGREFGVWAQGFGSIVKQGKIGSNAGYKTNSHGALVGIDTRITESDIIGAAFVYVDSTLKTNTKNHSSKALSKSAIFSLYGMHDFGNNWFANVVGTFGNTWNVSKTNKNIAGVANASKAKYSSKIGSIDVGAEYHYLLSNGFMLIPEGRVRALVHKNDNYKEKGGMYPMSIKSKTSSLIEGVFGAAVTKAFNYQDYEIIPSVYGKVVQYLGGASSKATFKLNGQAPILAKAKPRNKAIYNLGTDISIKSQGTEYGIGYDIDLARKYISQTGSLKLRVNL